MSTYYCNICKLARWAATIEDVNKHEHQCEINHKESIALEKKLDEDYKRKIKEKLI